MEEDGNRVRKKGERYFEGKSSNCFFSHFLRAVTLLSLAGRRKHRKKRDQRCRISPVPREAHHSLDAVWKLGNLYHMQRVEELMIQDIVSTSPLLLPTFIAVKTDI